MYSQQLNQEILQKINPNVRHLSHENEDVLSRVLHLLNNQDAYVTIAHIQNALDMEYTEQSKLIGAVRNLYQNELIDYIPSNGVANSRCKLKNVYKTSILQPQFVAPSNVVETKKTSNIDNDYWPKPFPIETNVVNIENVMNEYVSVQLGKRPGGLSFALSKNNAKNLVDKISYKFNNSKFTKTKPTSISRFVCVDRIKLVDNLFFIKLNVRAGSATILFEHKDALDLVDKIKNLL